MRKYNKKWMPVCMKDKSELLYCLNPFPEGLVSFGLTDSVKFSEVLPNGKKVLSCTDKELDEAHEWWCEPDRFYNINSHPENDVFDDAPCLEVKCPECQWVDSFKDISDIPSVDHFCPCCGYQTFEYFGDDEYELVQNGNSIHEKMSKSLDRIMDEYEGGAEVE